MSITVFGLLNLLKMENKTDSAEGPAHVYGIRILVGIILMVVLYHYQPYVADWLMEYHNFTTPREKFLAYSKVQNESVFYMTVGALIIYMIVIFLTQDKKSKHWY